MRVIRFDSIDSTQKYAKDLVRAGKIDFIVVSEVQTNGSGRHGRSWASPKGGLWFSFVCVKPENLPNEMVSFVTLGVGVTLMEVLKELYSCELDIKWPNDVLLNGKKVCGILCELVGDMLVCGVGVNTNVAAKDVRKFNSMAESLRDVTGICVDNDALMHEIVSRCIEVIGTLVERKKDIVEKMNEALAYRNEMRFLTYLSKEAQVTRVDGDGSLVVLESDEEKHIFVGEVL